MSGTEPKFKRSTPQQVFTGYSAMILSTFALALVIWFASGPTESSMLGGLNFTTLIFNWHPILMMAAFNFCAIYAMVSFRMFSFGKYINKLVHASFHTLAVLCFSLGLAAVVAGNNQSNKNTSPTGYYPDFFSLHSFLGLGTIILYGQNYMFGFLIFLFPRAAERVRATYVQYHIPLGYLFLVCATATICAGIMELNTEDGCQPDLPGPDTDPTRAYRDLAMGCKLGNGIGILVLLASLCTLFTVIDLRNDQRLMSTAINSNSDIMLQ